MGGCAPLRMGGENGLRFTPGRRRFLPPTSGQVEGREKGSARENQGAGPGKTRPRSVNDTPFLIPDDPPSRRGRGRGRRARPL